MKVFNVTFGALLLSVGSLALFLGLIARDWRWVFIGILGLAGGLALWERTKRHRG